MSRIIPTDQALSAEDRAYLLMRGEASRVDWFDLTYPPEAAPADEDVAAEAVADDEDDDTEDDEDDEPEDDEDPEYENWAVADLKAEIERRNKTAGDSPMAVTGVKADLAARLRENDAANA
jgi:hypothetical protein